MREAGGYRWILPWVSDYGIKVGSKRCCMLEYEEESGCAVIFQRVSIIGYFLDGKKGWVGASDGIRRLGSFEGSGI